MKEEEREMSFLDHLEELRWHVVRSLFAIIFFTIGAFLSAKWIFQNVIFAVGRPEFVTFKWLCKLAKLTGFEDSLCVTEIPFKIQSRYMMGQFTMHITSSFIMGLIFAFPYVAWEIWRFIRPGLHSNEKRYSRGAVFSISFLFFLGVAFGYYVMSPLAVYFLSSYQISDMISNEFDITSYVSTIATLVLGSGILFQLPVVIYFLSQIGMVTPKFLRQYRKHAIVIILVVAAIITPPDPLSQTLIGIPLMLLYEFSILVSAMVVRKKERLEAEELAREGSASQ
ncbi:MAG TPA: twin-arginine translocase subunit TatC [Cyclobacteriaceae bacterium]|nr:twin-arginine translocase subunit TatC [Cyclobacteriaceae bacterium]